jgi:type I restriction-modification system DNA methylase subunit
MLLIAQKRRRREKAKTMRKREKALLFVEHIERHIKNGDDVRVPRNAKVLCKFCDKTIDQIANEGKP